jgi:hypothetical protein
VGRLDGCRRPRAPSAADPEDAMTPRFVVAAIVAVTMLAFPIAADARPDDEPFNAFSYSQNMHPKGFSPRPNTISPFTANTDLAFWGRYAFQGHYDGFRVIDVQPSTHPREVSFTECFGNQGDVVVWENVLVRSWNSPTPAAGSTCDGQPVPPGFEGLHVFDISNLEDPVLVAAIETECGSHTATGVPDLANNRLLIYNSPSSGQCPGIDIVEVPLGDPASSSYLRFEDAGRSCHDTGVILGDALLAACAGGNGFTVWSLAGSLEDPEFLYSVAIPADPPITVGHSASFTWDGRVIIFGHEPGGGSQPRCTETGTILPGGVVQTDDMKSFFFFDSASGELLGKWVLPRPQTLEENCTLHNYNIIPTDRRYVLVSGNYQAGISVVDFTDPANAVEVAYADPAPLVPTQLGGDWSTYWYDGEIYESDITRGLLIWKLSGNTEAGAKKLGHLNPQTQEFTLARRR